LIEAFNCQKKEELGIFSKDYQALEFLGDAIIEALIMAYKFPSYFHNKNYY